MEVRYVNPEGLPISKSYTQLVTTNGGQIIYISGQVAADKSGEIMHKGDFVAQTKQVYENLKIALNSVGATFNDVIKTTTYVVNTDAEKIKIVREIRGQYHTGPNPPASTYVGVQGLADESIMVEIEAIVVIK